MPKRQRPQRAYARPTGVDVACKLNTKDMTKDLLNDNIVYLRATPGGGGVPNVTPLKKGNEVSHSSIPFGVIITVPTRPKKKVTHVNCMVAVAGLVHCPSDDGNDIEGLGHTKMISTGINKKRDVLLHGCANTAKELTPSQATMTKTPLKPPKVKYTPLASPNNFDVVCDISREEFSPGDQIFPGDIMIQVRMNKTHRIEVVSLRSRIGKQDTIPSDARIIGVSLTLVKPPRGYSQKKSQAPMRIPVRIGGCVTINATNKFLGENWTVGKEYKHKHFFMKILGWKRKDTNQNYVGGLIAHIGTLPRAGHKGQNLTPTPAARGGGGFLGGVGGGGLGGGGPLTNDQISQQLDSYRDLVADIVRRDESGTRSGFLERLALRHALKNHYDALLAAPGTTETLAADDALNAQNDIFVEDLRLSALRLTEEMMAYIEGFINYADRALNDNQATPEQLYGKLADETHASIVTKLKTINALLADLNDLTYDYRESYIVEDAKPWVATFKSKLDEAKRLLEEQRASMAPSLASMAETDDDLGDSSATGGGDGVGASASEEGESGGS